MAIGLGKMLGFDMPKNFDYPYLSTGMTEFWRRWHITLGSWFREYVYIPLGGNRGSSLKTYRNLFVVWLLTGIWHGASWNFAVWGILLFHCHENTALYEGSRIEKCVLPDEWQGNLFGAGSAGI